MIILFNMEDIIDEFVNTDIEPNYDDLKYLILTKIHGHNRPVDPEEIRAYILQCFDDYSSELSIEFNKKLDKLSKLKSGIYSELLQQQCSNDSIDAFMFGNINAICLIMNNNCEYRYSEYRSKWVDHDMHKSYCYWCYSSYKLCANCKYYIEKLKKHNLIRESYNV